MARYTNSEGSLDGNRSCNVDLLATELRQLTSDIHAVFLFENEARDLLRKLCQLVGIAAEGKLYDNWMHFAEFLKVPNDIAKNIGNWLKAAGGPVEHVLLAYVQESDATLDKVILALQKSNREDMILRINDDVRELVVRAHSRPALKDANGIYRLPDRPFVPLILESENSGQNLPTNVDCQISYVTEPNNRRVIKIAREKKLPALTLMLTCARDGVEAEKRIAKKLRSLSPEIGVVVLSEQQKHLWAKNRVFILDCIKQVDVMMPVVTKGYVDAINGRTPKNGILSSFDVEQQYAKYIYDTMSTEYLRDGCINNRIRCILAENVTSEVLEINPEIQIYFGENEIEELVKPILEKKLRKRERRLTKEKKLQESCTETSVTA